MSLSFHLITYHTHHRSSSHIDNIITHESPQTPSSSKAGKAYFPQTTDMPPKSPMYIVSTSMNKDNVGFIHISGEVKNNGTQAVSVVDVISSFYDSNNLLLTSIEASTLVLQIC
jgi:predicted SnoaL-like aldol condensation-catalyzing enzyme